MEIMETRKKQDYEPVDGMGYRENSTVYYGKSSRLKGKLANYSGHGVHRYVNFPDSSSIFGHTQKLKSHIQFLMYIYIYV